LNGQPTITGSLVGSIILDAEPTSLIGEFDSILLTAALRSISLGAMKMLANTTHEASLEIQLKGEALEIGRDGVIEWRVSDASNHDPFHSFAGSTEIRLSLAARVIEAHGGLAQHQNSCLCVRLPLAPE